MTPVDGRDAAREHPAVLPWYVTGRLEPDERARIEAHLRDCAECRGEVEALASMRRTHLAYREDLEQLERMTEAEERPSGGNPAGMRSRLAPWAWALGGAAAATLVFLALPDLRGTGGRAVPAEGRPPQSAGPPEPVVVAARAVVLLPARRDAAETPTLTGTGPWSIQVVLPLGSPEGEYVVRIGRAGGAVDGAEIRATAAAGGQVTLIVKSLPGPGRYRMTVVPPQVDPAAPAPESIYVFEVVP